MSSEFSVLTAFHTLSLLLFHSCIFHPCYLLLHFPLLHFPSLLSTPAFSTPAFSTPAFSAPPIRIRRSPNASQPKFARRSGLIGLTKYYKFRVLPKFLGSLAWRSFNGCSLFQMQSVEHLCSILHDFNWHYARGPSALAELLGWIGRLQTRE